MHEEIWVIKRFTSPDGAYSVIHEIGPIQAPIIEKLLADAEARMRAEGWTLIEHRREARIAATCALRET